MEQAIDDVAQALVCVANVGPHVAIDDVRNALRTFAAAIASEVRESVTLELRAGLKNLQDKIPGPFDLVARG